MPTTVVRSVLDRDWRFPVFLAGAAMTNRRAERRAALRIDWLAAVLIHVIENVVRRVVDINHMTVRDRHLKYGDDFLRGCGTENVPHLVCIEDNFINSGIEVAPGASSRMDSVRGGQIPGI